MGNKPDMFPQCKSQKVFSTDITVDVVVRSSFTWSRNTSVFITARKRCLGQGFFLHLSVILFTGGGGRGGGCLSHCMLGYTHTLDTHTPLDTYPLGHTPPGHHTRTAGHRHTAGHTHTPRYTHTHTHPWRPPGHPPGYYGIRSTNGWYASYWNAYLYLF